MRRKTRSRIIIFFIVVLLLAAIVLGLLQYGQVQGFKNTLKELVEEGTDGKLALDLGKTTINYLDLSFRLDDVSLTSTADSVPEGIQSIVIPSIRVDIGSLFNYAFTRQLKIEEVTFVSPYAKVGLKQKENNQQGQRVNIAHELAGFAPGIRAFLEKFEIVLFQIEDAGAELKPPDANSINLSLIDLLVKEWDMRDLDSDANIQLGIRHQSYEFSRSGFSFEKVSYDYKANILSIQDYAFHTADTAGREILTIEGTLISIGKPDFEALLEREEYIFGHLQITDPEVTANIYAKPKSETNLTDSKKSRHPLSDVLKENLGNMTLSTGLMENAHMNLNLFGLDDTISVVLPGVTIKAKNMMVREDSSTMLLDELSLAIAASKIDLDDDLELSFSSLEYDRDYNLFLTDIQLLSRLRNKEILNSNELSFYNLSIFTYLYENSLQADSIKLIDGEVNIGQPPKETFSDLDNGEKKKTDNSLAIDVSLFILQQVELTYALPNGMAYVRNVSARVEDIEKTSDFSYRLQFVETPLVKLDLDERHLEVQNLFYRPRNISLKQVTFNQKGAKVRINDLIARPENFLLENPNAHEWEELSIGMLEISGDLNDFSSKKETSKSDPFALSFNDIRITKLLASISQGDSLALSVEGDSLEFVGINSAAGNLIPDQITGTLTNLDLSLPKMKLKLQKASLDSRAESVLSGIGLYPANGDSLMVSRIYINDLTGENAQVRLSSLRMHDAEYFQRSGGHSMVDSLSLLELRYDSASGPHLRMAEVFGPDITLVKRADSQKTSDSSKINPFSVLDKLIIHPGQVSISDNTISFGDLVYDTTNPDEAEIRAQTISMKTEKNTLAVARISSDLEDVLLEEMSITPDPVYVSEMEIENDVIAASFRSIRLHDIPWQEVRETGEFKVPLVSLDGFTVDLKRDKTLPDPEEIEKPFLLSKLIPLEGNVDIDQISAQDGRLTYAEVGEKTGEEGHIVLSDLAFSYWPKETGGGSSQSLEGTMSVYDQGTGSFVYREIDSLHFTLQVRLEDIPLPLFNQMIDPLEAVKIKSGFLHEFDISLTADSAVATGETFMTYEDLHIELFKRGEPDVKNVGSTLLTLLADGIILRHSKENVVAPVIQERITYKSPINYWVKSIIHGVMAAVRKGKKPK